ncbi:MAG: hypothetical protein V4555_16445, partial [Acidobacteriota bacterium]
MAVATKRNARHARSGHFRALRAIMEAASELPTPSRAQAQALDGAIHLLGLAEGECDLIVSDGAGGFTGFLLSPYWRHRLALYSKANELSQAATIAGALRFAIGTEGDSSDMDWRGP